MNCLFSSNTLHITRSKSSSQQIKIYLKNRYFDQRIHWVPLDVQRKKIFDAPFFIYFPWLFRCCWLYYMVCDASQISCGWRVGKPKNWKHSHLVFRAKNFTLVKVFLDWWIVERIRSHLTPLAPFSSIWSVGLLSGRSWTLTLTGQTLRVLKSKENVLPL